MEDVEGYDESGKKWQRQREMKEDVMKIGEQGYEDLLELWGIVNEVKCQQWSWDVMLGEQIGDECSNHFTTGVFV